MKILIGVVTLLLSWQVKADDCKGPLVSGQPGVIQCDVSGPDGDDSIIACVPGGIDRFGTHKPGVFGPIQLKSYNNLELLVQTTVVDSGRIASSRVLIQRPRSKEVMMASLFISGISQGFAKIDDRALRFICRP